MHLPTLSRIGIFGAALVALGACTLQRDEGPPSTEAPIQGGTLDAADPAVGLVWFAGGGFCTGTLIAADVVLTAGHCVQNTIDGFYTGAGTPTGAIGASPPAGMVKHATIQMVAHPTYSSSGGCPNTTFDLGLVHLAAPIAGVAPIPIATGGSPVNATTCEAIGYGTHDEPNGQVTYASKRKGTEVVQGAGATYVDVKLGTGLADHGDSGGPLICNGVIAGATSCHNDGNWPAHKEEFYARVDAASAWISSTIAGWDKPLMDAGADARDAVADAPSTCAHPLCATGATLSSTCDSCAAQVCAADAFCCQSSWDQVCVGEVTSVCHQACR